MCEQVREDGGGVGEGGEDDEGADEGGEGGGGEGVDEAEEGGEEGAEEDCAVGVVMGWGDVREEGGEGHCVVAGQGPEGAGGGDGEADAGEEGGKEGEEELGGVSRLVCFGALWEAGLK